MKQFMKSIEHLDPKVTYGKSTIQIVIKAKDRVTQRQAMFDRLGEQNITFTFNELSSKSSYGAIEFNEIIDAES